MIGPHVDAAALLAAAREQTGLHDYGDESFVEPFEHLVDAINETGSLDEAGQAAFAGDMARLLGTRLGIQAAFNAHPEIADEDVSDPILITGLPRTGTTKLHRVLATDPGLQRLLLWQVVFPVPFGEDLDPDPRVTLTEQQVAAMVERHPELMAAHPLSTHEPEEEGLLLQLSFRTLNSGWIAHAYSFVDWVTRQDQTPAYADLRRTLQYLQWQDGGRRGRPWLLKAPIHLNALDVIAKTFPQATVVHCHRDLHEVIPSAANLYELMHGAYGAGHVELEQFGCNALLTALGWEANLAQRANVDPDRILDVQYDEIRSDVGEVVKRILGSRGATPSPELLAGIERWERENPQHRHGKLEYSLDRYGLTTARIDEAFSAYTAYFTRT